MVGVVVMVVGRGVGRGACVRDARIYMFAFAYCTPNACVWHHLGNDVLGLELEAGVWTSIKTYHVHVHTAGCPKCAPHTRTHTGHTHTGHRPRVQTVRE